MKLEFSRRDFMRFGATSVASYGLLNTMGGSSSALGAGSDTSGYKAMVCVSLLGGNNGFNWVVPTSNAGYSTYSASRRNLALAQNTLLPLNGVASDGYGYGFHPSCPEMQALFNGGKLGVVCNMGTLVQPTTAAQARAGSVSLPLQLFSHTDQQTLWMTSIANSTERYGWAGRVADLFMADGARANLAFNVNVGGTNFWQEGKSANPYFLGTGGAPQISVTGNSGYRNGARRQAALDLLSQAATDGNVFVGEYAAIQNNAAAKVGIVNNAFAAAGDLATPFPAYPGDSNLGQQLHQVARCIKARSQIGDSRQIFYVQMLGYDTHNGELGTQQSLLRILSQNLATFSAAMAELGMQDNVTLFTESDFGRSLGSNGDGSDHAWGSHAIVMGGAVQGGRYYGTMPNLAVGGSDDMGNGRIVPTTSTEQHAATLCRWFGVQDADLNTLFPNLKNFSTRNLGFLG